MKLSFEIADTGVGEATGKREIQARDATGKLRATIRRGEDGWKVSPYGMPPGPYCALPWKSLDAAKAFALAIMVEGFEHGEAAAL